MNVTQHGRAAQRRDVERQTGWRLPLASIAAGLVIALLIVTAVIIGVLTVVGGDHQTRRGYCVDQYGAPAPMEACR